jgi:hypothetical protein
MSIRALVALLAGTLALIAPPFSGVVTAGTGVTRYTVVLAGTATEDGFVPAGTGEEILALVTAAGGTITLDLSRQIGVLGVESANGMLDEVLRASPLVDEAAEELEALRELYRHLRLYVNFFQP